MVAVANRRDICITRDCVLHFQVQFLFEILFVSINTKRAAAEMHSGTLVRRDVKCRHFCPVLKIAVSLLMMVKTIHNFMKIRSAIVLFQVDE